MYHFWEETTIRVVVHFKAQICFVFFRQNSLQKKTHIFYEGKTRKSLVDLILYSATLQLHRNWLTMLAFVPVLARHSSILSSFAQHETITQTDKPNKINGKHCMHAPNIDIVQMKFHGGWPLLGEMGLVYWSTPKRTHIL